MAMHIPQKRGGEIKYTSMSKYKYNNATCIHEFTASNRKLSSKHWIDLPEYPSKDMALKQMIMPFTKYI